MSQCQCPLPHHMLQNITHNHWREEYFILAHLSLGKTYRGRPGWQMESSQMWKVTSHMQWCERGLESITKLAVTLNPLYPVPCFLYSNRTSCIASKSEVPARGQGLKSTSLWGEFPTEMITVLSSGYRKHAPGKEEVLRSTWGCF